MAVYTSKEEIETLFSIAGVVNRTDDIPREKADQFWASLCETASREIDLYLERFYWPADLATHRLVRYWTTLVACHLLSERRGNPAQFATRYERILDMLQQIYLGIRQVPGLPLKAELAPAMSNLRIDDRFAVHKIRVVPQISVGRSYPGQQIDPSYLWEMYW